MSEMDDPRTRSANDDEPTPRSESLHDAEHRVRTADGATLHVRELVPPTKRGPRVVVGHAMMVDARTLYRPDRPSLVGTLLEAGLPCYVANARGRDGKGGQPTALDFGYDAHVEDAGQLLRWLRTRGDGPIALVGHSLFGHTSLAHLARYPEVLSHARSPVVAHVGMGSAMWLPSCEPKTLGRARKRTTLLATDLLVALSGRMPVRRLGAGSCDEPKRYWQDFGRMWRRDRFESADGFDYRAAFEAVRVPSLQIVSEGDTWMSKPDAALRFTEGLPTREVWHLGSGAAPASVGGLAPSHMGLVTDPGSEPLWQAVAAWLNRRA